MQVYKKLLSQLTDFHGITGRAAFFKVVIPVLFVYIAGWLYLKIDILNHAEFLSNGEPSEAYKAYNYQQEGSILLWNAAMMMPLTLMLSLFIRRIRDAGYDISVGYVLYAMMMFYTLVNIWGYYNNSEMPSFIVAIYHLLYLPQFLVGCYVSYAVIAL